MPIFPPWIPPPHKGKYFSVPEVDNLPDLYGEIDDPQLVVFFNGNQFMVVNALIAAFQKEHPDIQRIFIETLPPGVLVEQIEQGALVMGNLRIAHRPDILTGGKSRIEQLDRERGWFTRTEPYARNTLGLMVRKGNPANVHGLADLGRDGLQISMPDPEYEGIGRLIVQAYEKAGGQALVDKVMKDKVQDGSTFLTQIHHRQTPMRILRGDSQVGPVWRTEALFQKKAGNPIDLVEIEAGYNQTGVYVAAQMKTAPHPHIASDFLDFLIGPEGQAVYREYGFEPLA